MTNHWTAIGRPAHRKLACDAEQAFDSDLGAYASLAAVVAAMVFWRKLRRGY